MQTVLDRKKLLFIFPHVRVFRTLAATPALSIIPRSLDSLPVDVGLGLIKG
jgi:hypothetical protein